MFERRFARYGMILFFTFGAASFGRAQTPGPAAALVGPSLQAHVGAGGLPADLTIQGQVTDLAGTRPLRMQIKGKDKIRYELGSGTQMRVSIFNAGSGWTGTAARWTPLPDHVAVRHAAEVPFLDVIAEAGNPRFKAFNRGLERIGAANLQHLKIRLNDPTPGKRFLNRSLHEDVDLFIDPATNLIVRSERMQAAGNSMDFRVPYILDFSDYRLVNGLVIPFRIVNTVGTPASGRYQSTWTIQSVLINQGIADSVFQPR